MLRRLACERALALPMALGITVVLGISVTAVADYTMSNTRSAADSNQRSTAYAALSDTETVTDLAPVTHRFDGLGRIVHTERTVSGALEQVDATYDAESRIGRVYVPSIRRQRQRVLL